MTTRTPIKMLGQGDTEGVFQLESSGMKQVLVGLQPQNLEDVIALISLYRPGPMDSIPPTCATATSRTKSAIRPRSWRTFWM